jgi:acyl CoA:acetate/3-ketoacid CoA transferase alpha subunit
MPKETRHFDGRSYVLEESIHADFSLVKGHVADEEGNVIFNKAARNFNPDVAKAGRVCIVEVEEIVKKGDLNPDHIHLPSNYVQRLIKGENYEKPFEQLNFKKAGKNEVPGTPEQVARRTKIAKRAAREL